MIEANELRVGNLIKHEKNILTVFGVAIQERDESVIWYDREGGFYLNCKEIEPIPLTPEILQKCGFQMVKNGIELKVFEGYVFIGSLFDGRILTLEIDGNRMPLHKIKYVHQLQNIYFALSGEELEIKL